MWIHWWDDQKQMVADHGRRQPNTRMRLRSEHHRESFGGYAVNEVVPKFLVTWLGTKLKKVAELSAVPETTAPLSSRYWSEPWPLAGAARQDREAVYKATLLGGEAEGSSAQGAIIRCAELFIEKAESRRGARVSLAPGVDSPLGVVQLGEASLEVGSTTSFAARAPLDPLITISLLQGEALLRHLVRVAEEFAHGAAYRADAFLDVLGGAVPEYFAGQPLAVPPHPIQQFLEPAAPLRVEVSTPRSDTLRAAFSVLLEDEEAGARVVSEPVFLTAVRGEVIASDLPRELLSAKSVNALDQLHEADGNISRLASRLQVTPEEAWSEVVAATLELGTATVDDALSVVTSRAPAPA